MIKTRTAAEWRSIQSALLVDVQGWQRRADEADNQPGMPQLIGIDYAMAVREGCLIAARGAQTAADQAALFAEELEAQVQQVSA